MGTDMPNPGERPIKIDKNAPGEDFKTVKGSSVLNAERLREHVSKRHIKSNDDFYSVGTPNGERSCFQEECEEIPRLAFRRNQIKCRPEINSSKARRISWSLIMKDYFYLVYLKIYKVYT